MEEVKKNNVIVTNKTDNIDSKTTTQTFGFKINPVTFMSIVYGNTTFYSRKDYSVIGQRVALASKIGHAGNGCMPGLCAVFATVTKVDKIKDSLYRYTLDNIDVFQPVKVPANVDEFVLEGRFNYLDRSDNTEWLEEFFYPQIKGAYINYKGEWTVPEPEYL